MTPSHLLQVPDERAALAPYNFVPLPERVVPAEAQEPIDQSHYHAERFTGRIECLLATESPLFVRCGLTPEQLEGGLEAKHRPDFFFTETPDAPVIPGSSLRGMLRALVEIAAYGKLDRVTNRPRYFYRAVAAKGDDPLANPYRAQLRNVKAGYLTRQGDGWAIIPSRPIGADSFIKVRENDVPPSVGLVRMSHPDYLLQRIAVSFTHKRTPKGRTVVERIDRPGVHQHAGTLVTSGNMIETGRGSQRTPRKNHVVIPEPGGGALPIAEQAVEDYRNGLSDFIVEQLGPAGVLAEGAPVFYCEPGRGEREVTAFGHSPNFRLPYRFPGSERAATPRDFVPEELRQDEVVDLAEALFGFVRGKRQGTQQEQAVAGRVFVGDAVLEPGQGPVWLSEEPFTPHILGSPKPTTFQHYLVQPGGAKRDLKHYASRPEDETTIRGHKLYWHKGPSPALALPPDKKVSDTQTTTMRPVRAGVSFRFTLHVENLSQIELGALLWVLRLGGDPAYRLKLGMGKPLGMGAVRLGHAAYTSRRAERYRRLFDGDGWAAAEAALPAEEQEAAVAAFEAYVLEQSGERGRGYTALRETLRMRCLLALLSWPGPLPETTRYLEIERGPAKLNEYKDRPVLPLPTQVADVVLSEADLAIHQAQRSSPRPVDERPARQEAPRQARPEAMPAPPPKPAPHIPAVGEVFTGKITQMDASAAAIEVPGFAADKALALLSADVADLRRFRVGNAARVEVLEQKTQRSGRVLLVVKPAPPKPKEAQA